MPIDVVRARSTQRAAWQAGGMRGRGRSRPVLACVKAALAFRRRGSQQALILT